MYEIWLALNIVWEMALLVWPWLLALALLGAALWLTALARGGARWRAGLSGALGVGVLAAAAAVATLPLWSRSSWSELAYWVDWANLAAIVGIVNSGKTNQMPAFGERLSAEQIHVLAAYVWSLSQTSSVAAK